MRCAVILAGGKSSRMIGTDVEGKDVAGKDMQGMDKAIHKLAGQRLIDIVIDRLGSQTDLLLISGGSDYGTGLQVVADRSDIQGGPAVGVFSSAVWIKDNMPEVTEFVSVPVDTPFLPSDLIERLLGGDHACAVVKDALRTHPIVGRWPIDKILALNAERDGVDGLSMFRLAERCGAGIIHFDTEQAFTNINTPEELARAEQLNA